MIQLPSGTASAGGLLWLVGILLAGFVVSWVSTEVLHVRRTPYIAVLSLATLGLVAGYAAWSGLDASAWSTNLAWGVVAALVAGGLLAIVVNRAPIRKPLRSEATARDELWEGLVYGGVEGALLSVLPVLVTWQLATAAGWAGAAAGAAAIAASMAMIVVHHLGYAGYRSRQMVLPVVGCTLLTLAYLLSGSPVAAMGGHVLLHAGLLRKRLEMPPEERIAGRTASAQPA